LRGADLWHLASAKTLQEELPELILLTFDDQLMNAVTGERLIHNSIGEKVMPKSIPKNIPQN
jgi:hypothetical protein